MRFALLAILATVLSCAHASAQSQSSANLRVILHAEGWELVGDKIVVPADSKIEKIPAAELVIDGEWDKVVINAQRIEVKAGQVTRSTVAVDSAGAGRYFITESGQIWYTITMSRREPFDLAIETGEIVIGPAIPDEPDKPDPKPDDIAPDEFGNIGQRVAALVKGLGGRGETAACYRQAAALLRDAGSLATVDTVSAQMVLCLQARPEYKSFTTMRELTNAELRSRWPMTKGVYADFLSAIAKGLDP